MRLTLLFLALAGCAASPPATNATTDKAPPTGGPGADAYRAALDANEAPFRVPGTVAARLGEQVQIGDVRVRPIEVLEDSRCPIDVTCVWAGRVRVRVAVSGAGEPVMEIDRPVIVSGGRRLILVAVAPPNRAHAPARVDPDAPKRFAFRLSGMD